MLFWIPSKPISELFHIHIVMKRRDMTISMLKNNVTILEGYLIFSHSIGTLSEELQEECLPAINRRPTILSRL